MSSAPYVAKPFKESCLTPTSPQRDEEGQESFLEAAKVLPLGLEWSLELTRAWVSRREEEVTCPRSPGQFGASLSVAPVLLETSPDPFWPLPLLRR